jgi:hypothetical protein
MRFGDNPKLEEKGREDGEPRIQGRRRKLQRRVRRERRVALYVAQLYDALRSNTWAEFRASLPAGGWEEFVEKFGDSDDPVDDFPTGSEPFDRDYMQTGYPEWLANTEIRWFPNDLIKSMAGALNTAWPATTPCICLLRRPKRSPTT